MTLGKTTLSFAAVAAILGHAATAQDAGTPAFCQQGYVVADTNDDGMIDAGELSAAIATEFESLDANDDGTVTAEEFAECRSAPVEASAAGAYRTEENMAQFDLNQDQRLDLDEFMGTVGEQEYVARWGRMPFAESVRDERGATAGMGQSAEADDESGTADRTGEAAVQHILIVPGMDATAMSADERAARTAQLFVMLDADQDRAIDMPEWVSQRVEAQNLLRGIAGNFERIDTDDSGDISPAEYAAYRDRRWNWARTQAEWALDDDTDMSEVGAPVVYYRYPHPM